MDTHTIPAAEALRKLAQLTAVLIANDSRERIITADQTTDLAGFIVEGRFDHARLIPLIVVAINDLAARVANLEKE